MSNSKTKISLTSISDERFKIADSDREMFKEKNGKNKEKIKLTQKANDDNSENDIEIEEDENSDFSMENNEEVNKKADAESESIKEYDLIDDAISENLEDDKGLEDNTLDNFKEKVKRSGVIYISYIPEGMTVSFLRKKLQKYGANRVFLVPDTSNSKSKKRQNYKEGWIEFTDKIMAKLCEYEISGKIFGGKKRNNKFREEIWNLKYLNKFKWHHLMEKLQFNKKLREHRMKAELSQSKRENNFILEKFEQSRKINFLNKKRVIYSPKIIIKF
jgi:ESF2/ABP1 family protein